ncbi:uncharacterized protein LOC126378967 isoform X2 [Pectinophora gossypiella]|uniref:uncharacterized protein LOC126378967 isoform X2 n=1 Tax=Pectinophora gossypiella TaxID=13191 RepID=UPI00214E23C5|nr:uncharacterized protein LOC126378967 isoform X2 [Pectinophora gossypiella]
MGNGREFMYVYMSRLTRMAEEAQLQAEEKWLVETLTRIKHQKNCLHIERLHLEGLKAKHLREGTSNAGDIEKQDRIKDDFDQKLKSLKEQEQTQNKGGKSDIDSSAQLNACKKLEDNIVDTKCNEEELNLAVSKSAYAYNLACNNFEESDEDEEEDDVMVDIDMFMFDSFRKNQDE